VLGQGIPADSIQRALARVFERPSYSWVERRTIREWVRERWRDSIDWLNGVEQSNPALFKVMMAALIVLLVVLVAHIAYTLWRVLRRAPPAPVAAVTGVAVVGDMRAHFRQADALAAAGRCAEALGHKFLGLVIELDRLRALRFHPSKTPAEYIGEVRLDPPGRESLADVVARLYRHVFGAQPCDAEAYRAFGAATQLVLDHAHSH
jgi:hypothetical protein